LRRPGPRGTLLPCIASQVGGGQVGLTSPGLPYLLALLGFIVLLVIVLGWPWMGRRGATRVCLRILSLCLLQVLILGLIFVVVNRSGEFYSSWSDLLGTDSRGPANVVAVQQVPTASRRQLVVTGSTPVRLPYGHYGGVLEGIRISGELSGLTVAGDVYLPQVYLARGSHQSFPVLTVISDAIGGSGSPYSAHRLVQSAAMEIAANQMGPLVIVMLPATVGQFDKACLNLPPTFLAHKPATPSVQGETFFAQDVPSAIESAYRVLDQPASWALLGDQSGGYCALHLAFDDSQAFSAAVVPPGSYTRPPGGPGLGEGPFRQQDNLAWQLEHLPPPPVSVLFAGSRTVSADAFISLAQRPLRFSTTQLDPGTWPLAHVLDWIAAAVGAPAGQIRGAR
jgi:putative esterase